MSLSAIEHRELPDKWSTFVEACGGGFFHMPAALPVVFPPGVPSFIELSDGAELAAVALACSQRCRFGSGVRHVRLLTPPAVRPGWSGSDVMATLLELMRRTRAAEVHVGSFGQGGFVPDHEGGVAASERREFVVHLDPTVDTDGLLRRFAATHRRHARRGERRGWNLSVASADSAPDVLFQVQSAAARRAAERSNGYQTGRLRAEAQAVFAPLDHASGVACFAAEAAGTVLCAALIGWANGQAFYLRGGSTATGYTEHAAFWMHWQIMSRLAAHGMTLYNLGGTPAAAAEESHPQHGLFRFKSGLGSELVSCRGAQWVFRPWHMRTHGVARLLRDGVRRRRTRTS